MGQEIEHSHFSADDFRLFEQKLEAETRYLGDLFAQKKLSQAGPVCGFEIEAWLIDHQGNPLPANQEYLDALADPMVVHELSRFNIELNIEPENLQGDVFSHMQLNLQETWNKCTQVAEGMDANLVMIGILPSVHDADLSLKNMTRSNRYKALNEQVLALRNNVPLHLDIHGRGHLNADHFDVMLESAATSFQIHLQTPLEQASEMFNRAIMLSAPMVAATANSPYLFGHELWDETRIPLFEQAVECGELAHRRVTFGDRYNEHNMLDIFIDNIRDYPVLVPNLSDDAQERMPHLRFHNGTIWRWNRPLLGFDPDGSPHLRIEHRVVPAGPSIPDTIANAAFFYGMMYGLTGRQNPGSLPFTLAKENFYLCARDGLHALVNWPGSETNSIRQILLEELIPMARIGLSELGVSKADNQYFLDIIEQRVSSGQNGAEWQRRWVAAHGKNMQALTLAYLRHQNSNKPVASWSI